MTFDENPFRVLNVSMYDTQATIVERADDLSFADPEREDVIERARDILLNPQKRIAAEVRWFVGCSREEEQKLMTCPSNKLFTDYHYDDDYDLWLAEMNSLIYSLETLNAMEKLKAVSNIDVSYSFLDADEICDQINAIRAQSKFPVVKDTAVIRDELKNIRYELRGIIQDSIKKVSRDKFIEKITDFAEATEYLDEGDFFGVIVEDFIDDYRLKMTPFLDETTEKIFDLLTKIENRADANSFYGLSEEVESFVKVRYPLDKFSIALGTNDFRATKKIFYAVRNVAIKLFNEKNLIDYPMKITRLLAKEFDYLPELSEVITKDVKFLEKEKALQPTQSFLDAIDAINKIQSMMDQHLHYAKDFERTNMDFYEKFFKPNCDVLLTGLMTPDKFSRKPKEWTALNVKVAVIYLHMGAAMTWTRRADLAFDCFQKALPYAEASGDTKLIELINKRVIEWREIAKHYSNGGVLKSVGRLLRQFLQTGPPILVDIFLFIAGCFIITLIAWIWDWLTR